MIDALSAEEPDNPYFYELKAQIYMEQGNLKAAKEAYGKVLKLRPDAALLQVDWAQGCFDGFSVAGRIEKHYCGLKPLFAATPFGHGLAAAVSGL